MSVGKAGPSSPSRTVTRVNELHIADLLGHFPPLLCKAAKKF